MGIKWPFFDYDEDGYRLTKWDRIEHERAVHGWADEGVKGGNRLIYTCRTELKELVGRLSATNFLLLVILVTLIYIAVQLS